MSIVNSYLKMPDFNVYMYIKVLVYSFVGDPTEKETEQITQLWQTSLFNANYEIQRWDPSFVADYLQYMYMEILHNVIPSCNLIKSSFMHWNHVWFSFETSYLEDIIQRYFLNIIIIFKIHTLSEKYECCYKNCFRMKTFVHFKKLKQMIHV